MQNPTIDLFTGTYTIPDRDSFSCLEWLVIAIGARDESIPLQWSPIGRSLLALLGGGPKPLSSPCLELLRRTASVARHYGWAMPTADIGAFLHAGWSEAQLERLIESVCPETHSTSATPFGEAEETGTQPAREIRTLVGIAAAS